MIQSITVEQVARDGKPSNCHSLLYYGNLVTIVRPATVRFLFWNLRVPRCYVVVYVPSGKGFLEGREATLVKAGTRLICETYPDMYLKVNNA